MGRNSDEVATFHCDHCMSDVPLSAVRHVEIRVRDVLGYDQFGTPTAETYTLCEECRVELLALLKGGRL